MEGDDARAARSAWNDGSPAEAGASVSAYSITTPTRLPVTWSRSGPVIEDQRSCPSPGTRLFVVGEHADDLHRPLPLEDLVDEAVVDVDPAGEGASEIADQLLEPGRGLEWIPRDDLEQGFGVPSQAGSRQLPRIPAGLDREDDVPGSA